MKSRDDFVRYVTEDLLSGMRGTTARAMFGGHGLYKDGVIFGIIVDDVLYLKVDETNRSDYEAEGSQPFTYQAKGRSKPTAMSYWEVPARFTDDRDAVTALAEKSLAINLRAKRKQAARGQK